MGKQIITAAVNGFLRNDMSAALRQSLQRIRNRRRARRKRQSRNSAFERGYPFFEYVLRGIRKPAVNVARVGQSEARGGVFAVFKYVRSGGVKGLKSPFNIPI